MAGEGLTVSRLAAVLGVYLVAGVVKGALGFGLPLVAGAVLPQIVPLPLVLAVNALILPVTNLVQAVRAGDAMRTARMHWPVFVGLALAVPLAALFVARADPRAVAVVFGAFVAIAAAASLAMPDWRVPVRARGGVALGTGLVGGLVAALTTAPGPVFMLYLAGTGAGRRETMGALGQFLLAGGLLVGLSFAALGVLTPARAGLALACLVPALAGMRLGDAIGGGLPDRPLRIAVLTILVVLGLRTAATGLVG